VTQEAIEIAREVMLQLNVVGVLCVEFFLRRDGHLLINELAPRPHNSGHLTIDAHVTSQFDQQVRAVCGLPLGSTRQLQPAAMANILGDCWSKGTPNWLRCIGESNTHLHLYGKREALPGRKMGHLTTLAESATSAADQAIAARQLLCGNDGTAIGSELDRPDGVRSWTRK
jgi:5-(carboxyamino)imidazole ribonucleotide synthase